MDISESVAARQLKMSSGARNPVVLTAFSFDEKDTMDTYHDEWQSIHQTRADLYLSRDLSGEAEEEKEDQGE